MKTFSSLCLYYGNFGSIAFPEIIFSSSCQDNAAVYFVPYNQNSFFANVRDQVSTRKFESIVNRTVYGNAEQKFSSFVNDRRFGKIGFNIVPAVVHENRSDMLLKDRSQVFEQVDTTTPLLFFWG